MLENLVLKGSDLLLTWDDIPTEMRDDLSSCSHQGECDDDVNYFIFNHYEGIDYDPSDVRNYLTGYGAWDDEELTDTIDNLSRIIWIIAGSLNEYGEVYLSTY